MFLCLCGNQGPAAAGGLGGPPAGSEGQKEAVITQENTGSNSNSPPLSPASTNSEASLPGVSQECDTASIGDETTTSSTPCVTCVSELPSSAAESIDKVNERHQNSLGNSVSHSVGQSIVQNGVKKDSEYESAEELDSPSHDSPKSQESLHSHSSTDFPEAEGPPREKTAVEDSAHTPIEYINGVQTDSGLSCIDVKDPVESDKGERQTDVPSLNVIECNLTETTSVSEISSNSAPENNPETVYVTSTESEHPVSTVCESVLTLTKNEIVEESIIENTVLVEQQVIAATHPTSENNKPVDVGEINLDIVTSSEISNAESSESPVCVSFNVNEETTESSDKTVSSEESKAVFAQTGSEVTQGPSVSEAFNKQEDTPQASEEETRPSLQQETENSVQEKQETNQDSASSSNTSNTEPQSTEPQTTFEETTFSSSSTAHKEESPPPPPDPDDIPIPPKKGYDLGFLDNLDDPNFDPFASKKTIRNTPPPSPEPGCKLPPLKPAIKRKNKKSPQPALDPPGSESKVESKIETDTQALPKTEKSSESPSQNTETLQVEIKNQESESKIQLDGDSPSKGPVRPLRKPLRKTPLKPKVTETNNNTVEEESKPFKKEEEEDYPIPPSKGYNLDFLDNLDDPNFNPFANKTTIRNSPTQGGGFPANRSSPEVVQEEKPKVVVARKPSPKKGFTVPRKNSEVKSDSPQSGEESGSQADKKQEPLANPEIDTTEPSPAGEAAKETEEEPTLPKKGYNLDFLDDPNFDPFQSKSCLDKAQSGAKNTALNDAGSAVIDNTSAKVVASEDKLETVVNRVEIPVEESLTEHTVSISVSEKDPGEICINNESQESVESENQEVNSNQPECVEEISEARDKPKNQLEDIQNSCITKDANQTTNQNQGQSPVPDSENNWNTEDTEPHLNAFRTPSIGTIGQLDSLEFDQLLEHEASRLADEFMNCSRDSGLADYDETPDNHYSNMADTRYSNLHDVDENVNPFQKSPRLVNSPPLGKRGAVCGAESTDPLGLPFSVRRSLKRDIVMGEERQDTSSLDDDSGIVIGSRCDLETEVNHSEAGPEIATGLTSSDLRCASQFFKEATDLETQLKRNLLSPLLGSHSKLSGDVTPTKDKKEPPAGAPESPQNKPTSTTSSPAPPPREERSAPEGTSSPSPRPNDTAERKSLATRPTSAPPEGYMTASEVQELLKRQELKFEEKLLRVELAAGEKEKKLQQTMKDEQKELTTLGTSVTELTQSRDALLKMVTQYKGMMATLVSEKEKEKKVAEDKIIALQGERDQALEDLANVEVAFSDVHRKYERTKQVVDTLKRNEETLRGAVSDYEAKLKKQEQKFLEFQKHAEEKIQLANEEYEGMRKCNEQEMTKMAALLKKAEMKIMSLQDSFDRKTRENQELTQLCDDLINKVGTSH